MVSLEQVAKTTGVRPPQLDDIPPIPDDLKYVWDWYHRELWTSEHLTYSELMAWAQAMGVALLPWESRLLISLNRAHVVIANE